MPLFSAGTKFYHTPHTTFSRLNRALIPLFLLPVFTSCTAGKQRQFCKVSSLARLSTDTRAENEWKASGCTYTAFLGSIPDVISAYLLA